MEQALICIPRKENKAPRWAKLRDCLWEGPECLRRFVALKHIYPSCQRLFRDFFLIPDAGIKDLVREAKLVCRGDPLPYIRNLLLEMEKHLEKDESITVFTQLQFHSIWPIYNGEKEEDWDTLEFANGNTAWFIADRAHLLDSFRARLPLVAFQVEDVLKMPLLMRKLGVDKRRLTRAITSIAKTTGTTRPSLNYQEQLRSKVDFIAR